MFMTPLCSQNIINPLHYEEFQSLTLSHEEIAEPAVHLGQSGYRTFPDWEGQEGGGTWPGTEITFTFFSISSIPFPDRNFN
jgi:hypothetical protein